MKIASTVSRYLLGLLFTVFGANGFLHFITPPPPSTAFGGQFMSAVSGSHFMIVPFALQLFAGVALLAGRFVPLALVVLAAIITNILNYHITMDPAGLAPAIFATVLWFVTAARYRKSFDGILESNSEPSTGDRVRRVTPAEA